jgi:Spy/CpxP family protein refolding chaperone
MKFNKTFTVSLVLTIIIAGAFATQAMSFGEHRHGTGLFGLKRLLELNLSDSQKSQILSIFGKYDLKSVRSNLWQARKDLRTSLSQATSEDSLDGIVTAYLSKVAPLQQQMLSMRAKMVYEIKAVLTPDQLQLLQQHKHGPTAGSSGTTTP